MDDTGRVVFAVVVITLVILLMIIAMVTLMAVNSNRRIRHRAELAELQLRRDQEVMQAEREAIQHTLGEVGRELHDNVGQLLTVAQMGLARALEDGAADPGLRGALGALDEGIEEVRRLGHSLNTDLWQERSLADAISAEAERIERVGRVHTHIEVRGTPPVLPPDHKILLFRVFQELVNNALKHSGADTISVILDDSTGPLLTVADNGRGFDAGKAGGRAGLVNIRRRCALIGFEAICTSAPGTGCTWRIQHATAHGT
jgi:two-component system, NarL family, sensor kinase